ncbi:polysaccharide biosynthesis/export family protein [Edaphobacter bradus]|uniref:polysaccharide biosynthesis/export family protein n=1 Tax=Edaphobacter bradus TaxID=2259016 RepID=UPI0021E035B4|nr:polysaccharide biosynthesis/export family protein [Edaphobacter bradus]
MRHRHHRLRASIEASSIRAGRRRIWTAATSLLSVLLLMSCVARAQFSGPALGASTPVNRSLTPTTDQAILFPPSREIRLGAGDLIAIHVYGETDFSPSVRVSMDGTIQLPLIGTVAVDSLSLHEASRLIAQRLVSAGMYRNPQVTIQLIESPNQLVTVTGELHGIVPITGQRRLFDVLSAAGGLPPTASHVIMINRPGVDQTIVIDMGTDPAKSNMANVPVFARDTIVIPRVGVVYVLGAFKTQGAIPIVQNSPLTLMQVASLSGGTGFEGKYNDLRLIRTVGTDRKVVRVDIKRVINGKDPDPVLQADDIVFLPNDAMKSAIKSGGLGTLLGLASILIIAIRP